MNYELYAVGGGITDEAAENLRKHSEKVANEKANGKLEDVENIKMNLWVYATIADSMQECREQIMMGNPKGLCVYDDDMKPHYFDKYEALATLDRLIADYFGLWGKGGNN